MNVLDILDTKEIPYKQNEPMAKHTTFKIGGNADLLVLPDNEEKIIQCFLIAKEFGLPAFVMGNGSNILVHDGGIRGMVIVISNDSITCSGNVITAGAGALLSKIAAVAANNSKSGLEFASGIPGTLGGAVRMNAGAYGPEMRDVINATRYLNTETMEVGELKNAEQMFSYRSSLFCSHPEFVILSAEINLQSGNYNEIMAKTEELNARRRDKQPLNMPSAGSTFKRPEGGYAAQMIEACGLKGFSVGGARVSEKHAGFVVNASGATAADVIALIEHAKSAVYDKFNVMLECEILIVGEE